MPKKLIIHMKKLLWMLVILLFVSCKKDDEIIEYGALHWQVTLLLPDNGLGDEGLFDRSFEGVMNFYDMVGMSSVDLVLNLPYAQGESDSCLVQWIAEAATTTVNHRLLFCPMPSEAQCEQLDTAVLAKGDEVLIVCGNSKIADKLQSMENIAKDKRFHVYTLDTRDAGVQAGTALANIYKSDVSLSSRKCAAILTTKEGLLQNSDLIEGFKAGVKSVVGEEPLIRLTDEKLDSTYQVAATLAQDYACILPATYCSNYGAYCALMDKWPFHTVKLDGVTVPVATTESIRIDRNLKTLAYTLLQQWREGVRLEHFKNMTIPCEQ